MEMNILYDHEAYMHTYLEETEFVTEELEARTIKLTIIVASFIFNFC
jgi:hypothetical protein